MAEALVARDFDLTICTEMALDHGAAGPLRLLADPWPAPVIPVFVNTIRAPLPRPARLHALGRALRGALDALPARRVVVLGTGGLSHQLHGAGAGRIARAWDEDFLDRLAHAPDDLAARDVAAFAAGAGTEGLESMMWLAMRGALPEAVRVAHRAYHPVGATGLGLLVLEPG